MVVGGRAASLLPLNLPHLQNLIKRDSASYRSEFVMQQTHFYSTLDLLQASGWDVEKCGGGSDEDLLENLITFMAHVTPCYGSGAGSDSQRFVGVLMELLEREAAVLPPGLRRCMCEALVLMRSKKGTALVPTERMLKLFFRLFALKDKHLRCVLYEAIVADIRKANHPHRNNALNRTLQSFMYSIFTSSAAKSPGTSDEMSATKSLQVIIELYRRGIWNDAKTVNIIAEAALKGNCPKTMVMALNFFLGKFPGAAELGDEDEDEGHGAVEGNGTGSKASIAASEEYRSLLHACQVGGVSKAKKNRLKRVLATDRKRARSANDNNAAKTPANFSPLSLVNDPQGFAERLYRLLKASTAAFEVKLLVMSVLSRFIAWHKLIVLDFYAFLLRYLQPHQRSVTQILAYTAQATHTLIPPDTLYPVLKAIADNFVSEGAAEPVIAAGLNGIREICSRAPLAMTDTLLQDLTTYKKGGDHKNKGVMMASRSLISLFREINPELLHRRDRGRDISMAIAAGTQKKSLTYGQVEQFEIPTSKQDTEDMEDMEENIQSDDNEQSFSESESVCEVSGSDIDTCSDIEDFVEFSTSDNDELPPMLVPAVKNEVKPRISVVTSGTSSASKRVKFLSADRILLPEDYETDNKSNNNNNNKKKNYNKNDDSSYQSGEESGNDSHNDSENDDDSSGGETNFIDPSKIEGYRSKAKADYEARLASIHAGREGRDKFGTRKRGNSRASSTNKEKSKAKNFLMMAHKSQVQGKRRLSLKAKQAVQKKHRATMKRKR
jgi:protein SDA1